MRILHVIHGYPMRFNAGSEVYTQSLAHAQVARGDEVRVFTRCEDPFAPDGAEQVEADALEPRIQLHVVNVPNDRDRYRRPAVDAAFGRVLDAFSPHVVHAGHLNHLSTSLLEEADRRGVPIVFTLHDFWLLCPRGQLIQMHPEPGGEPWALCPGQEDRRCAERCYARYFSGAPGEREQDVAYWTDWVHRRMAHVRDAARRVDLFISPSASLRARMVAELGLPADRVVLLDYGFPRHRLAGRNRVAEPDFVFGYIGTHIPAKGIHHLLEAFAHVPGRPRLRIWGRTRPGTSDALMALASRLPPDAAERIEWRPEYENRHIVRDVLDHVDALVVPSIWPENSPLVIHEAQQARVPVITADAGGMADSVQDGVNGLLFQHRDPRSLAAAMKRLAADPALARRLGERGCLASPSGDVIDVADHAGHVEALYARAIRERRRARAPLRSGPWRVTFDTNPDDCNLRCVMCEEHSPHSPRPALRRQGELPHRRMPFHLVPKVLRELRPTPLREVIPSTMGEPLLYDGLEDVVAACREEGLFLNLTTNGTFPRRGARGWARLLLPVLSDVKISWNGATAETQEAVMQGARFEAMVQGLRDFIQERDAFAATFGHRPTVTLQLTFVETNVAELPDIVRLAAREGVDRVKGHQLWAHFEALEAISLRRSPEAAARWNAAVEAAHAAVEAARRELGRAPRLENVVPLRGAGDAAVAPDSVCPFLGQEAWVSALGRFDPCCAPDAQRRTLGEFGNLHQTPLLAIWDGDAYRSLAAGYREKPLCRGCTMRRSP
ncbi:MAG TPA: glycosyltransferase [Myxococcales bacterium]|nr:glycosyltransferase [Myxococcales bacterium]